MSLLAQKPALGSPRSTATASFAPEVVESGSARRRKYTKAAWRGVYSLARLWFERLELSRRLRCEESEGREEARGSTEGRYRSIPSSTPYPRHDDKHDGREMGRRNRGLG